MLHDKVGKNDGVKDGNNEGDFVGCFDGECVGFFEGDNVGTSVGKLDGALRGFDGNFVGLAVGNGTMHGKEREFVFLQ